MQRWQSSPSRRVLRSALLALIVAFGVAPAAAHAELRVGEATDPSFDQATGGRDLTELRVRYDTAGIVEATVILRGEPSLANNAVLTVLFGVPTASGRCGNPAAVIVSTLDPADDYVAWALSSAPSTLRTTATKSTSGTMVTLRGSGAELAGAAYTCAFATIEATGSATTIYDESTAPVPLVLDAPTPLPTTTPAASPTPAPTPAPTPTAGTAAPAERTLRLVVIAEPAPVARNRWRKVRVGILNGTAKRARGLRLTVAAPRGVRASATTVPVPSVRAGAAKTITIRLRPGTRAPDASPVRFTLRAAGKVLSSVTTQLRVATKPGASAPTPPSTPGTAGTPNNGADLTGRLYARFDHELRATPGGFDYVAVIGGYAFVSPTFVYSGLPAGGLPTCTERTAKCLPYTYDAARNTLTIDGKPVELSPDRGRLQVDGKAFFWNPIPAPGTRFTLTLKNISSSLFPYDAVTSRYLRMSADGRFDFGAVTAITPGASYDTVGIVGPPTQRGTYEVLDRGRLRLQFESGRVLEHTISQFGADPAKDGLLLDSSKYWV